MSTTQETGTVLDRIIVQTRIDIEQRKRQVSPEAMRELAWDGPVPTNLAAALRQDTVQVIAEVKRASPSKGRFPVEIDPPLVASQYAAGSAAGISCLTDGPFFQGSLDDLRAVTRVMQSLGRPIGVLRKDFTVDSYQIDEARAAGASAILLIVACLTDHDLHRLHAYAQDLGMTVIVEVHEDEELKRALAVEAQVVGINNRNLKSLKVDLEVTQRLAPQIPSGVVVIGESGIFARPDVETMAKSGVDAILVGESLILQNDRAAAVQSLLGVVKLTRG